MSSGAARPRTIERPELVGATVVLDLIAGVVMYFAERHATGTQIHTIGRALFFVTTQLLTVSSSMANPLTVAGRVVNVALELWGGARRRGLGRGDRKLLPEQRRVVAARGSGAGEGSRTPV